MENIKTTGITKYLPNIATLIRLFGSFSLFFVMNFEKDIGPFKAVPWVWLIVYLFLVLTDTIDGKIARKFNVKSDLGAFLDAFSDTVLLVIAAATVFVKFASDNLTDFQTWLYVGLLIFCSANKLSMNLYAKKFFGVANMLHSYPQKAFAVGCYVGVGFWAFIRDVPWWSVVILIISNLYGAIDEIVYCARAASYDVDFKGHGFQKYEKRKINK
jgi:phosphatidylglycerophosphate synthase